ncbi:transglycosylase SLT domain-containing protein [Rubrivivax sp. RP6-9]|uniref:transglycosylase SLT domain-containing protein n=1 Tax=Rubrivivax sp. RP6-9 TaxID=3415750 RepID=UPI003CC53DC7
MSSPPQRPGARLAAWVGLVALLGGCATAPLPPVQVPQAEGGEITVPSAAATQAAAPAASAASAADPIAAVFAAETAAAAASAAATVAAEAAPDGPVPSTLGRLDAAEDAVRTDLWVRVRSGFALPDLDNDLVRKWEQWYATRPDYVERMTERGGRYLFHIVEEVERRGMPVELALLPFIESAFNPQAMSHARAAGMWQFMPMTGKDFELKQNLFRDDRRDVLASTRAALDYLQQLHQMFGDWHLALAAYNWGQGNVLRAIKRNERAGLPTDYERLRMPDETRNYVPKLQAVKNIVLRPDAFALALPALENHPFFLSVPIERDIDVALAARLAGLSLEEFQQLNPQMNKPVILAAGTPQVLLPYDNANIFLRQLQRHEGPLASWTAWVAPATLKPADAARRVGMTESELREVNRIPARMLVKAGSTLLVPRDPDSTRDVAEHIADNATMVLAPESRPTRRVVLKAGKKGDSVVAVARRYRVSAAQVAQWNGVGTGARFKAGQSIVVHLATPAKKAGVRSAAKPSRSTKAAASKRPVKVTAPAGRPRATQAR